ncbi:MAG TPA: hypothetical protein VM933_08460, partial [Acidimicrobiales bacterium]|nr:hypothetical protein [Acidimicrobiales bacterium]
MTWRALVVGSALLTVAACGRGGDPSPTVIGRVSSISGGRACASPDRGATQACVDVDPDALEGVEVGA